MQWLNTSLTIKINTKLAFALEARWGTVEPEHCMSLGFSASKLLCSTKRKPLENDPYTVNAGIAQAFGGTKIA